MTLGDSEWSERRERDRSKPDPTYPDLVATVADLRDQLAAVTAERDQLRDEVDQTELQRNRDRRLNYIARGWGP